MRAAERRREQRRRLFIAAGSVVTILVVIGALFGLKAAGVGSHKKTGTGSAAQAADAALIKNVTTVPTATLDTVGTGTAAGFPKKITAPALTTGGKPQILYVGAEYCPFCAAERWGIAVALSRFGTLSDLSTTTSSAIDTPASVPTLSFHGTKLKSAYITFVAYETTTNKPLANGSGYEPLDTLNAADKKTFATYNAPPYVPSNQTGSIPFTDFGGKYVLFGASYSPDALSGKTHAEIAAALADPTTAIAKAVDGAANIATAAICATTSQQPSAVCAAAGTKVAASHLPAIS
jgi:hypothetical protein